MLPSTLEAPDYYTKFVPHADRIDLDKPVFHSLVVDPKLPEEKKAAKLAAEDVTKQLIGYEPPAYYQADEFLVSPEMRLHPIEIEARILREAMRDRWCEESKYGELCYIHGLRLIHQMLPQLDITPSLADLAYLSMGAFGHDIKGIHSIGAQSMLKSYSSRLLSFMYQKVFNGQHYLITSTPTKEGSKDTTFGDIKEIFRLICYAHPHQSKGTSGTWLWPDAEASQQEHLYFQADKGDKGGWFENRALKRKVKGAKGAKGEEGEESTDTGIQEVDIDEVNEIENIGKFVENLSNMRGNAQFQLRTSQNPELETDSGGFLCEPQMWGDWGYSSFDEIRDADPIIWPTKEGDMVYRFDGHRCLNIILGKTIYPYMFNERRRARLERVHGQSSAVYQSQGRAMFSGESSSNKLLSISQLKSSRYDDQFFTIANIKGMAMGIDPAHSGGGDKAIISVLQWGDCIVRHPDGQQDRKRLLLAEEPLVWVKQINNFVWDPHGGEHNNWWDKFVAVGGDVNALTVGAPVTYEQQIAIEAAILQRRLGIPKKNVWFDFSMRMSMPDAMRATMGYEPVGIDANTKVRGHALKFTNQNTMERARSATQECILLMADVIQSKNLRVSERALSGYNTAFHQICRRGVNEKLKGNPPQDKRAYMAANGNKSPNEMDATSIAIGAAYAGGFRAESDVKPSIKQSIKQRILRPKPQLFFKSK